MCPTNAKQIINHFGLKSKKIAASCAIPAAYLSEWLNGKRILDQEQEQRLSEYFKQFEGLLIGIK